MTLRAQGGVIRVGSYSTFGEVLGKGTFATVYRGFHSVTMAPVAIKEIDLTRLEGMNPKHKQHLQQEVDTMKRAEHENIVLLLHVRTLQTPKRNSYLYIILEYCNQGDFLHYLNRQPNRRLSEAQALYFMRQFASGLKYLHDENIVHRDLKPQNLLLHQEPGAPPVLKIADFGFAKINDREGDNLLETLCGSPLYMAPEILRGEHYTDKADLWSVGAIFFEMLCGRPPFDCKTHYELFRMMQTEKIRVPKSVRENLSDACMHLLISLLNKDSSKRIPWEAFFSHPWITGIYPEGSPEHAKQMKEAKAKEEEKKAAEEKIEAEKEAKSVTEKVTEKVATKKEEEAKVAETQESDEAVVLTDIEAPSEMAGTDVPEPVAPSAVPDPTPDTNAMLTSRIVDINISDSTAEEVSRLIVSQVRIYDTIKQLAERKLDLGEGEHALKLYMHVLEGYRCIYTKLQDHLRQAGQSTCADPLKAVADGIQQQFATLMDIAEPLSESVVPAGDVEEILFQHALDLGREGVSHELNKNYKESKELYGSGVMLLEELQNSTSADDVRREKLTSVQRVGETLKRYVERLNEVQKRGVAGDQV